MIVYIHEHTPPGTHDRRRNVRPGIQPRRALRRAFGRRAGNGIPLPGVPRHRAAICDALPRERRRRDPRAIPVRPLRCDWRSGRLPGGASPAPQESAPIHESADSIFEHPFPILGPGDHHRVQSRVRIEHTASPDAATTSQKANGKKNRNPPHPPDDEEFGDEIEPEPPEEEQGEQTAMPAAPSLLRHCFLPHRAAAALRAISWRRSFVRARARRFPPTWPPMRANASLSSGVRFSIEVSPPFLAISWRSSLDKTSARRLPPRLPRATACGFFPTLLSVPPKPK